jgi:hypothetical protein
LSAFVGVDVHKNGRPLLEKQGCKKMKKARRSRRQNRGRRAASFTKPGA